MFSKHFKSVMLNILSLDTLLVNVVYSKNIVNQLIILKLYLTDSCLLVFIITEHKMIQLDNYYIGTFGYKL